MGLLFGRETRSSLTPTFPEPVIPPIRGTDPYGTVSVATNPDMALTVPTVWACVTLLANAVSMLPLETFRFTAGAPVRLANPPLLDRPATSMTQSEWLHMLMMSLLLRGNAYGLITARDVDQRPTQIELQNPDRVKVTLNDQGGLVYKFGPTQQVVPTYNVWHVRGMTLPGSSVGLSPIAYAAAALGVDIASRQFAGDFFAGGGIPKAVLETDQAVNQEQARTIKERLFAATQRREPIILGAGLKYTAISVRPEESQFLLTQQASVAQVARYFNIPAGMVGGSEGGSMTYMNVEQRSLDFLTYAVSFWLKRIEDATTVLFPVSQYTRFNTGSLLRTDAETSVKVDVQLIAGKIKVPSEIRAERDMPPMTEAQKAEADMVPLTITPMGGAKALPPPPGKVPGDSGPNAPVPADDNTQEGVVNV